MAATGPRAFHVSHQGDSPVPTAAVDKQSRKDS